MPHMVHISLGRRELRSPWWALLLTLCAVAFFAALGRWQWQRAAEKQALIAAFERGAGLSEPLAGRPTVSLPRYQNVTVRGHFDTAHQFLLDNISHGQAAGYEVLTPFELEDGRWLLVNRGWLPLVDGARRQLPGVAFDAPGARSLHGRLDELPQAGIALGRQPPPLQGSWPRLASFPHSDELAAALGRAIEPRQLLLAADEPDGYQRDWRAADNGFGPERHIAYAVQWWGLGLLAVILYLVVNVETGKS